MKKNIMNEKNVTVNNAISNELMNAMIERINETCMNDASDGMKRDLSCTIIREFDVKTEDDIRNDEVSEFIEYTYGAYCEILNLFGHDRVEHYMTVDNIMNFYNNYVRYSKFIKKDDRHSCWSIFVEDVIDRKFCGRRACDLDIDETDDFNSLLGSIHVLAEDDEGDEICGWEVCDGLLWVEFRDGVSSYIPDDAVITSRKEDIIEKYID